MITTTHKMILTFIVAALLIELLSIEVLRGVKTFNDYRDTHYLVKHKVVEIKFNKPFSIEDRELPKEAVIEQAVMKEEVKTESDIERIANETKNPELAKYICSKFPITECKTALAIVSAESGWREDAINARNSDGLIDFGIFQIHQTNWKLDGCSIKEIVDPYKNTDCAYKLWDRGDGKEGDHKGTWNAWSVYNNRAFVTFL